MSKMSDLHIEVSENAVDAFAHFVEHFEKPANPYAGSTIGADKLWEEKFAEHQGEYEEWLDEQADRQAFENNTYGW